MIFESLFAQAQKQPQAVAITDDRGNTTYSELAAAAAGLGMYLAAQTKRPRVGLLLPASAGFVASFYGTLLAGKTVVPINFLLGDKEIAHIVKDSDVDTVVTIPQLAPRVKDLPLNVIDLSALPKPPAAAIAPKFPSPAANDIAVLLYTSGTSGLPKGVLLSYGNLQSDADSAIAYVQLTHDHKFLGVIPLFHSFGILAMMIAPIQLGAQIIYLARFSPVGTMQAIREHKASLMFGTPSMYGAIHRLKNATAEDFSSIYALISGGEPLPASLREAFKERFGKPLLEGFGLTETSPAIALNTPQINRPGSVGKALPGAEFRIAAEDGSALPQGEIGEVWVKGPMIMKGYHNLPNETASALTADGYFKTGDLGRFDEDGFLYITGRKKEMIIVAGEKAYPREIEDALLKHPGVSEAAVMGRPDPGRGEVVVAFVVPKEGQALREDELRDHCRKTGLAQWKVPRDIKIVAEFPHSPTGKVLKRELAATLTAS